MGKIKDHCQDFLENGGYDLGFDMGYLPDLKDFETVLKEQTDAQTYSESRSKMKFIFGSKKLSSSSRSVSYTHLQLTTTPYE